MITRFRRITQKFFLYLQSSEDIVNQTYNFNFFESLASQKINKIIFVVKDYSRDIENLGIQCLKNNLKVFILLKNSFSTSRIEKLLNEFETTLIVFSRYCEVEKQIFEKDFEFDPLLDNALEFREAPELKNPELENDANHKDQTFDFKSSQEIIIHNFSIQNSSIQIKESPEENSLNNSFTPIDYDISSHNLNDEANLQIPSKKNSDSMPPEENFQNNSIVNDSIPQDTDTLSNLNDEANLQIPSNKNSDSMPPEERIQENQKSEFKPSFLTIRLKLLSITTIIIVGSLSLMIFFASFFFKRDIETRIQENNIMNVDIISKKIQDLFEQIYFNSFLISQIFKNSRENQDIGFIDNPYILGIANLEIAKNQFFIKNWYVYQKLLQEIGTSTKDFENSIESTRDTLSLSLTGTYEITNLSPYYDYPVLLLSTPNRMVPGNIFVIFINAKKISEDISGQTFSEIFILNRKGEILGASNIEMVQSAIDIKSMPIVKMMLESKLDNGLTNFNHNQKEFLGAFKKIQLGGIGIISITESKKAFEPVFITQRRNFYILAIVSIISIIIIYFFAKTISQPIKELAQATIKIEQEDYSVRVKPKTRDEVGQLSFLFNKMVRGLEEREKIKDAFGKFVNKEVAEKALKGEIKLGGEKKQCAVFFSDLRGFTAMSEKMKPEEVVEYLNRYFTLMVDCVEKTNGVVDKFIGDAVMATWGSVISVGNDAENAVNGALLMRKALIEFNKYNRKHGHPIAKFGCGINYGEVVAGQIGSEKKLEFTVIGDTVNLTSRIEGLNKPFATDILISQDLYERVKDIFNVVKMPAIAVKGKSEPQTIYCVLGRKDNPDAPKNLEELRKLVGIDWEPAIKEGTDVMEDEKEEKFKILDDKK